MAIRIITFPALLTADKLQPDKRRLFIGAYGFEQRLFGWTNYQKEQGHVLNCALVFRYRHPKGENLIRELRKALTELGVSTRLDITYDVRSPHNIENALPQKLEKVMHETEEIVIDISSMTKLMILVCLCMLSKFTGTVRIVYSEAENYAPTEKEYKKAKDDMRMIVKFPSRGAESIARMKCLSSIRMQGQPVTMVAFTSFNEQLVRHMLGTVSPHRLIFINGRPPRKDYAWRELATQEIHKRLIEEYSADNPFKGELLARVASTLKYKDTIDQLEEIYKKFGTHERIICAATGSKMQTVGLFFSKIMHPDIHIEYPTPDSYFVKGISTGVRKVHEIVLPQFSEFLKKIRYRESPFLDIPVSL